MNRAAIARTIRAADVRSASFSVNPRTAAFTALAVAARGWRMDLNELRNRCKALSKAINDLVAEFERESGVKVSGIRTVETMNGPAYRAEITIR